MQAFFDLIDRLSAAQGGERGQVEAQIWERFGVERTLLALDMSQFSLSVRRSGILPYLALIRRMQTLTGPIVESHRGTVIKYEADNLLATFAEPADAALAAIAVNQAVASGAERFEVAIGIDHGRFILIDGRDCYGDPVNIACKLGEDVANPREILLTDAAAKRLEPDFPFALKEQQVSFSGLELQVFAVDYQPGTP